VRRGAENAGTGRRDEEDVLLHPHGPVHEKDDDMTLKPPNAAAMYARVVASLKDMNLEEICATVHVQLTRLDDRKMFDVTSKGKSRDELVVLAARAIVHARLSRPSSPPSSKAGPTTS
jgi:hypothetical protein